MGTRLGCVAVLGAALLQVSVSVREHFLSTHPPLSAISAEPTISLPSGAHSPDTFLPTGEIIVSPTAATWRMGYLDQVEVQGLPREPGGSGRQSPPPCTALSPLLSAVPPPQLQQRRHLVSALSTCSSVLTELPLILLAQVGRKLLCSPWNLAILCDLPLNPECLGHWPS